MNSEYRKNNITLKTSLFGMAVAAAMQTLLPIHMTGWVISFAALFIVASMKKMKMGYY